MPTPRISFEFFPPRSIEASFRLWDCVSMLQNLNPEFVSVTYGAAGSTRAITHDAVEALAHTTDLRVAAHLTCVNHTAQEVTEIADRYKAAGVTDIVALRGDLPDGHQTPKGGLTSSIELVETLAKSGDFNIFVGAYPEVHPEATSAAQNIDYLKRKFDAGAYAAITQFFFDPETFLRFRDDCADAGITAPILPGILPVENWKNTRNFARKCGAEIPEVIEKAFANAQDAREHELVALAVAAEICDGLTNEGVEHLHFYTLNRPGLTYDVCTALGITPNLNLSEVA